MQQSPKMKTKLLNFLINLTLAHRFDLKHN